MFELFITDQHHLAALAEIIQKQQFADICEQEKNMVYNGYIHNYFANK